MLRIKLMNCCRFRWVFCQLDALKKSKKKSSILLALKQLPKTLNETYDRMLLAIDEVYKAESKRALLWLAFSERPLSVEEVAEAACIDPDADPPFSEDDRFQDPRNNIVEILGSLISLLPGEKIRLAHFSVKEYLLLHRLRTGHSTDFGVSELDAQLLCTRSCLAYILQEGETSFNLCELPFIAYACMYWPNHAQQLPENDQRIRPLIHALYRSHTTYENWQSMVSRQLPLPGSEGTGPLQKELSPLCHASAMGFTWIVEELLAEPEATGVMRDDAPKWTALHTASLCGKEATVSSILQITKQSSIIDVVSPIGTTALHHASSRGFVTIVSMLLKHGASTGIEDRHKRAAITLAAASGHIDVVQLLLENTVISNISRKHNETALFTAIDANCIPIIEKLLQYEVNTEVINRAGQTPILYATVRGQTDIVRLLQKHGANLRFMDSLDSTALHRAVQLGNNAVVELLIQHGADLTRGDSDGKTPFHYACARGSHSMLELFLQQDVDVSLVDGWGKMPIHYTAWGSSAEAMQMLLDKGAQIEARTTRGETPLQLAAQRGGLTVVECLLKNGADIEACDSNGRTALYFAVIRADKKVLELLLKNGADPRVKDHRGLTPIRAYEEYEWRVLGYTVRRID
jgi:ankyrin repeat protein